jgi:DNA-binding NtrC family response regulator
MTNRKILIVEDEFIIATDLKMSLKSYGYTVCDIIDKGEDVISAVEEKKPDIVLMDITLKGKMNGIDAATNLYNNNYKIPIIYISAEINAERLNTINIPNTYGFLMKPLREDTLYTTIEITASKYELEEKLKRTNVELEKTNEELEKTNEELEETIGELEKTNEELMQTYEILKQSEQDYRLLFSKMISAFAYHKIICDENNKPIDYVFLEINEAFEKFTGLTKDVIGQKVTDVFQDMEKDTLI